VAVAASLAWLATVRLELTRHGLTYRSLLGTRSLRWREVDKLFISWRPRYLARVIPWYRAYRIEVVGKDGRRLAEFRAGRPVAFGALAARRAPPPARVDARCLRGAPAATPAVPAASAPRPSSRAGT
jgi:hypothetical protein